MDRSSNRVMSKWPVAPGNAATIVMVCSAPKINGSLSTTAAGAQTLLKDNDGRDLGVPANSIQAVELTWLENNQASAANGIRLYALIKAMDTWREVDNPDNNSTPSIGSGAPKAVPVLSTPTTRRLLIDVARYQAFAVEYTAGATGPTETTGWNGTILLHLNLGVLTR